MACLRSLVASDWVKVAMNVFAFPLWLLRNADNEAGNQPGTGWPAMLAGSLRR